MLTIDGVPVTKVLANYYHSLPPVSVENFVYFVCGMAAGIMLGVLCMELGFALGRRNLRKREEILAKVPIRFPVTPRAKKKEKKPEAPKLKAIPPAREIKKSLEKLASDIAAKEAA
jgi:hypothetical protein